MSAVVIGGGGVAGEGDGRYVPMLCLRSGMMLMRTAAAATRQVLEMEDSLVTPGVDTAQLRTREGRSALLHLFSAILTVTM